MSKKRSHKKKKAADFNPLPWVAGAIFVLGMAVLAGMYWQRTMTVDEVRFGGYHFVTLEQLDKNVDIPEGIHPDSLNFMAIISSMEKINYVRQAAVNVEPSGDLLIQIEERKPIAMLADGEEKIYVDAEGVRLPIILGKAVDVPILYGFSAGPMQDTLKSKAWQQTRDFLVEVQNKPLSNTTISEIAWTEKNGIVALSHENGVKLIFGKEEYKTRLRNWEAFYSEIIREKGIQKMQSVDMRFKGQIVTREG